MNHKYGFAVASALLAVGLAGAQAAACASYGSDTSVPSPDAAIETATTTTTTTAGQVCTTPAECASGFCVDGVCCDSACQGTCESCKVAGSAGRCTAVPDGVDLDNECSATPVLDAGTVTTSTGDAAPFSLPDGGVESPDDSQCAGRCNGKRACAFKGSETTCGSVFCGNTTEQGRASCDGAGHCLYGIEECSAYACPDGSPGCKTTCLGPGDCLATHYCDGTTRTCVARLANGASCGKALDCLSDHCVDGICCNSACDVVGGTCAKAGAEGQCSCSACSNGACALFYRDVDGDGFGDALGTTANGNAVVACANGVPPAGFVVDNSDCFDSAVPIAASVHPGQTGYFEAPYTIGAGNPSFDYNCSGTVEQETRTVAHCGVCQTTIIMSAPEAAPAAPPGFCFNRTLQETCPTAGAAAGHDCATLQPCGPVNAPVFETQVECGKAGSLYTCDPCPAASARPPPSRYQSSGAQRCH